MCGQPPVSTALILFVFITCFLIRISASSFIGSDLLVSFSKVIPPEWADYNGHMTEYRYLNCFGDASDAVMNFIGCDKDYINKGNSYFTVETNIRHLKEIKVGEEVYINTKILAWCLNMVVRSIINE